VRLASRPAPPPLRRIAHSTHDPSNTTYATDPFAFGPTAQPSSLWLGASVPFATAVGDSVRVGTWVGIGVAALASHASPTPLSLASAWFALATCGQLSNGSAMPSPSASLARATASRPSAPAVVNTTCPLPDANSGLIRCCTLCPVAWQCAGAVQSASLVQAPSAW